MSRDADALVGSVLADKYRLTAVLGSGGFATVYAAEHTRLSSLRYAVKVLKRMHLDDEDIRVRFEREAITIAELHSRYTVKVGDFGVTDDEQPFIVMEYVPGRSLREVIDALGTLTPLQTAHIAVGVLKALDEAHHRNIVHRDLKPDNVVLTWDDDEAEPVPKVLDFGIAKVLEADDALVEHETATGVAMCTPKYSSPEVLMREPVPASDLYSLGLMMYELLVGHTPYGSGSHYEHAQRHMDPTPVPLALEILDGPLGSIIDKALQKPLTQRYTSAEEMLLDVRAAFARLLAEDPNATTQINAMWHDSGSGDPRDRSFDSLRPTTPVDTGTGRPKTDRSSVVSKAAAATTQFDVAAGEVSNRFETLVTAPLDTGSTKSLPSEPTPTGVVRVGPSPWLVAALLTAVGLSAYLAGRLAVMNAQTDSEAPSGAVTSLSSGSPDLANAPVSESEPEPADEPEPVDPDPAPDATVTPDEALQVAADVVARAATPAADDLVSLRANVDGALATVEGIGWGSLPVRNVYAPRGRGYAFEIEVAADGYETALVRLEDDRDTDVAVELEQRRRDRDRDAEPEHEPEPDPVPEPEPDPEMDLSGDSLINPFGP